jgi:hypothetical protein
VAAVRAAYDGKPSVGLTVPAFVAGARPAPCAHLRDVRIITVRT